jgi:ketosteroid isomerase-like protein
MRRWLLLFALSVTPPLAAEEAALAALLDAFLEGASRSDRATHQRFWAEDLIYTSSAGRRFGKAEILAGLPSAPAPGPVRYGAEALTIRVEGDIAVVTFRLLAEQEDGSRETFLNTGVLRKREGEWRAFAWQATREAITD